MEKINQLANIYKQNLLQKRNEMEECNHLFVKIQEGNWTGGFHSSDYDYTPCTVRCLKCGLTNYHINMDIILRKKYSKVLKRINPYKYYLLDVNDDIFRKQFGNINNYKCDLKDILNLISDEVLPTLDSISLYQMAKQISPNATNEELFEIMKDLFELEQTDENINSSYASQMGMLIDKYKNVRTKKLQ